MFQLRRDSSNVDAQNHLSQLGPLRENIAIARSLYESNDLLGAVNMLAQPIEVKDCSSVMGFVNFFIISLFLNYPKVDIQLFVGVTVFDLQKTKISLTLASILIH